MEHILDFNEKKEILSEKEIYTKIWTSPRLVFRFINDNRYDKYRNLLLCLAGISSSLDSAALKNLGDTIPLSSIIFSCIIFGGLFGWIGYFLFASAVSFTGKWLDGKGDTTAMLRIFSYAMIPSAICLFFHTIQIITYGSEVFKEDGDLVSAVLFQNVVFYGAMIFEFIFGIYALVFYVIGTSEMQKLPIADTILNLFLPFIVAAIPILIFYLAFQLVN